jgi:hypothetical protein
MLYFTAQLAARLEPGWLSRYSDGLRAGSSGFEIFLYFTASSHVLGPSQSPIQWIPWALSPGVKLSWRETVHRLEASAEIKNRGAIPPLPHFMAICLIN